MINEPLENIHEVIMQMFKSCTYMLINEDEKIDKIDFDFCYQNILCCLTYLKAKREND